MATARIRQDDAAAKEPKLASWKLIAEHFNCDERTAKRWEQERGLPVHRAPGGKRSVVFAYPSELDRWLRAGGYRENPNSTLRASEARALESSAIHDSVEIQSASTEGTAHGFIPASNRARRSPVWSIGFSAVFLLAVLSVWTVNHRGVTRTSSSGTLNLPTTLVQVSAPSAEDLYLQGRYFWNLRTADGLAKAIDDFTQAIVKNPSYAEAYAGLAEADDLLPEYTQANFEESLTKAKEAADRALLLNPNLAAAHRAKAFAIFYLDWNIAGSDAGFKRSLRLDPNSAETHLWYASTLQSRNEGSECIRQIDEALRLNPTSPAVAAEAAYFHADFGDFTAGVKALKEIEETQPTLASPAQFLRELDFAVGDFPGYVDEANRLAAITHRPEDAQLAEAVARGWMHGGRIGLLEAQARVLQDSFDQGNNVGYQLGESLLLLGQRKRALPYFRASMRRHSLLLISMQDCPWAKPLLGDPGYAALFSEIRESLHDGYPAHPQVVRVSIRLPQ